MAISEAIKTLFYTPILWFFELIGHPTTFEEIDKAIKILLIALGIMIAVAAIAISTIAIIKAIKKRKQKKQQKNAKDKNMME